MSTADFRKLVKRKIKRRAPSLCDYLQGAIDNARHKNVGAYDVRFAAIYLWTRRAYMIDDDAYDADRNSIREAARSGHRTVTLSHQG